MKEKLLGEVTVGQQGCFKTVRRYYENWFEPKGKIAGVNYWWVEGQTGRETMIEQNVLYPVGIFKNGKQGT